MSKSKPICQQSTCPLKGQDKIYNWAKTQYECPYRGYDFERECYVCNHPKA